MKLVVRPEAGSGYASWEVVFDDGRRAGILMRGAGGKWFGVPETPRALESEIQGFVEKFNSGLLLQGLAQHGVCTLCACPLATPTPVLPDGRLRAPSAAALCPSG